MAALELNSEISFSTEEQRSPTYPGPWFPTMRPTAMALPRLPQKSQNLSCFTCRFPDIALLAALHSIPFLRHKNASLF